MSVSPCCACHLKQSRGSTLGKVRLYIFRWNVGTWIIEGLLHPLAEPCIVFWVYGCYLRRRNKQGDGSVFAIDNYL